MRTERKIIMAVAVMSLMMFVAGTVRADWNPGDSYKMHYPQLPDLTPAGMDVNATFPAVLADDFLCTSPGPITDIHIWGSWIYDKLPPDGLVYPVSFTLSIHGDIPIGPDQPYSRPGNLLWNENFDPSQYTSRPYASVPLGEGFYDPATGILISPADYTVWQYNFQIDSQEAFYQQGSAAAPMIYWLEVSAFIPANPGYVFGWKTSPNHWNDDAAWTLGPTGPWFELCDPAGQSLDLAFVITPEPATMMVLALGGLAALLRKRNK